MDPEMHSMVVQLTHTKISAFAGPLFPEAKAQEHFCPTGQVGPWGAMSTLPSETHSDHSILNHLKAEHITHSHVPRDSNS